MPIGNTFTNLFGKSPIKPIQQHMAKAHECASQLSRFFDAVLVNDWQAAEAVQQEIKTLEHAADKLKKSIRLHLPKSLFMPMPRSDLLELITMQDKIANCAKDIAGLMLGRQMRIPEPIAASMKEYVEESINTCEHALIAISELDELVEAGFGHREIQVVEELIEKLDAAEYRTDVLQVEIRAKLFGVEKDLPPVDVVFLYKIIDWIGELADRAQKVGSRLQLLLAR